MRNPIAELAHEQAMLDQVAADLDLVQDDHHGDIERSHQEHADGCGQEELEQGESAAG